MTTFHAILVHGKRGGEGHYEFDAPDGLLGQGANEIMCAFMESVEARNGIGEVDHEIRAVLKSRHDSIATILGELTFDSGDHQPFMCMISDFVRD